MAAPRRIEPAELPRLRKFWEEHWTGGEMIVHGEVFRPEHLDGFVADDWVGVLTYAVRSQECEIISMNSLLENRGIGTSLIEAVTREARARACTRICVSTTNDNLRALGFYQKRGFRLISLRPGAVDESRRLKPAIPRIGDNGIPLRDEIELEMTLRDG